MLNLLKGSNKSSVIPSYFKKANVAFTSTKLNELLKVQPNSNSLLGVSDILNEYNVRNLAVRIESTEIAKVETPYIAHLKLPYPRFVLVTEQDNNRIKYIVEDQTSVTKSISEFIEEWNNIVLLAAPTEESGETDYKLNRREELLHIIRLPFCIITGILIIAYLAYRNFSLTDISSGIYLSLVFSFTTGCIVSILLMIQTIDKNSSLVSSICTLGKTTDCNSVLESSGAKLLGVISWSDIGFVYFLGNLLTILSVSNSASALFFMNVCTLPYTFWSIYYQYRVAKQWCVLCLSIQALFWLIFILYVASGAGITFNWLSINLYLEILLIFLFSSALLWFFAPFINRSFLVTPLEKELNSLKANEIIFESSLKSQKKVAIEGFNRIIAFGGAGAPFLITMVTNPYCGPCAVMHKEVSRLLQQYPDYFELQILHAATKTEHDKRNDAIKYLIGTYIKYDIEQVEEIYSEWYETGRIDLQNFRKKYPIDLDNPEIKQVFDSNSEFCMVANITETPTIYINGYKLPNWYNIEDLKYFLIH